MSQYKDYGYKKFRGSHAHAYLIPPIIKLLEEAKPKAVFDLGCGNGYVADQLIQLGFNVYGADASKEGIALARERHPDRFSVWNVESPEIPKQFENIEFDLVLSVEVIEHIYDPRSFIKRCSSILNNSKTDKRLILTTPYHGYLKNLAIAIAGGFDRHVNPLWDGGHIKFWSRETLSQLVEEEGFVVEKFVGAGRVAPLWKSMILQSNKES